MEAEGGLVPGDVAAAVVDADAVDSSDASFLQKRNRNGWKDTETNCRRRSQEWKNASRSLGRNRSKLPKGVGAYVCSHPSVQTPELRTMKGGLECLPTRNYPLKKLEN